MTISLPTFPESNAWHSCLLFPKMIQRFPTIRRFPNVNEEFVSSSTMCSDTVWRIQTRHIALFIGLCFLVLVQVYIFFESVSVNAVIAPIFHPGVRNWSVGERAWDQSFRPAGVRITPKAWELAGIWPLLCKHRKTCQWQATTTKLNISEFSQQEFSLWLSAHRLDAKLDYQPLFGK